MWIDYPLVIGESVKVLSALERKHQRYGLKLCMGRMKQAAYPWWT